jgi:H2-forming N5,N10-methylenetetrahydromethanopterin dehydrogenase-like enzyme
MTFFTPELPDDSITCSTCTKCFTRLFHKIKNVFRSKKHNKYQTKRKDLNSRLILGDDY